MSKTKKIIWFSVPRGADNIYKAYIGSAQKREENISRLVSLFPDQKEDIINHIEDIETKTYGFEWCYKKALSGMTWGDIKKGWL